MAGKGSTFFIAVVIPVVIAISAGVYINFTTIAIRNLVNLIKEDIIFSSEMLENVSGTLQEILEVAKRKCVTSTDTLLQVQENGAWEGNGVPQAHVHDQRMADAIIKYLTAEKAHSICDLGAGMGFYTEALRKAGFFVSCYDGNPDTQKLSDGKCAVLDLSLPLRLSPHDWVLSLEVGEHIPQQFESNFFNNIQTLGRKGAILSWAIEGQGGYGHVNNHNNSYVEEKMKTLGFKRDKKGEKKLRDAAIMGIWFKNTTMIFQRKTI